MMPRHVKGEPKRQGLGKFAGPLAGSAATSGAANAKAAWLFSHSISSDNYAHQPHSWSKGAIGTCILGLNGIGQVRARPRSDEE